jgi:hypothetical protein
MNRWVAKVRGNRAEGRSVGYRQVTEANGYSLSRELPKKLSFLCYGESLRIPGNPEGEEMKKILIGFTVLVVLVVVAVFVLIGNIDKIVKGAIEGVGSELLGTPVGVTAVKIKIDSGSGQISGLTIANPTGFSPGNAFQMDLTRLDLNLKSLGKQPMVIDDLTIKSPVVRLEVKEDGSSNLQTLLNNIEKNSKKADQKAADQGAESQSGTEGEPIRMSFGNLAVTGVTVHTSIPGAEPESVVIPDIVLTNVGGETGLTPGELGSLVLGEIIASSLETALKKEITEQIEKAGKGLFNDIKSKLLPQ